MCKRFNLTSKSKAMGLLSCGQIGRGHAFPSWVFQSSGAHTAHPWGGTGLPCLQSSSDNVVITGNNNNPIDTTEIGKGFERDVFPSGRCSPCPWHWQAGGVLCRMGGRSLPASSSLCAEAAPNLKPGQDLGGAVPWLVHLRCISPALPSLG